MSVAGNSESGPLDHHVSKVTLVLSAVSTLALILVLILTLSSVHSGLLSLGPSYCRRATDALVGQGERELIDSSFIFNQQGASMQIVPCLATQRSTLAADTVTDDSRGSPSLVSLAIVYFFKQGRQV